MGTATVQLNTRIDPMLKAGGDAVLTRNGLGASDAIRALWVYSYTSFCPLSRL